uniref:Uncharacterized protein n=1 Tax=Micrurus carvalhoi TaxID=3147026 RepID=A0A2H6N0J1_9SAUR
MVWDFIIQTGRHLSYNSPDFITVHKKDKEIWIMGAGVPRDSKKEEKELEKTTKYNDVQKEDWQKKAPITMTNSTNSYDNNTIPEYLECCLNTIGIDKISIYQLQKSALHGLVYVLQQYL